MYVVPPSCICSDKPLTASVYTQGGQPTIQKGKQRMPLPTKPINTKAPPMKLTTSLRSFLLPQCGFMASPPPHHEPSPSTSHHCRVCFTGVLGGVTQATTCPMLPASPAPAPLTGHVGLTPLGQVVRDAPPSRHLTNEEVWYVVLQGKHPGVYYGK